MKLEFTKRCLEKLYDRYNRREFIHPDPLEFVYRYDRIEDREIVALVASSLAYGRVGQILKSVEKILEKMGESPARFVREGAEKDFESVFNGFRHRFTTGSDVAFLLAGAKEAVGRHGSLEACFVSHMKGDDETVLPALEGFVCEIMRGSGECCHLAPSPARGSACKRMNLFLKWMSRSDDVDPGGWTRVPASKLVVPLDTHMHRICRELGITARKQADLKTALEITGAFREIAPSDPAKYDFVLTRDGIWRNNAKLAG